MNYFFIIFALFALSKNVISQSTVADLLKDGFGAVFDYSYEEKVQHLEAQSFKNYRTEFLIYKASDDGKFIIKPIDFHYDGNNAPDQSPTPADLKAMKLPILASVNDQFTVDYIKATSDDTKYSLIEKKNMIDSVFGNMTDLVMNFPNILSVMEKFEIRQESHVPFGKCNIAIKMSKTPSLYVNGMSTEYKDCSGPIDANILKELKTKSLDPTSNLNFEFLFKQTLELEGVNWFLLAKDKDDPNHTYKRQVKTNYKERKSIDEHIDESQFTDTYLEKDLI